MQRFRAAKAGLRGAAGAFLICAAAQAQSPFAVVTHHYDIGRTGWNQNEVILTPANVAAPGGFGLQRAIAFDGQIDAQPLVVPGVVIAGDSNAGQHDVVYVATENNTVYAVDPGTGAILLRRNFGTPVSHMLGCNKLFQGIGIQGTPVIDTGRNAIYLISYTSQGAAQNFTLHKLNLSTFADMVPPVTVAAAQTLANGTVINFNSGNARQRPALLDANNAIYAGFGSVCDSFGNSSRGWIMGWSADTLQPLAPSATGAPAAVLTNRQSTNTRNVFLSSIWMSGAGLAADSSGIYAVTGNTDTSGLDFDSTYNPSNTVLKIAFSTMSRLDYFTPYNVASLDIADADFGAGGIMLLPPQGAGAPPMATAAGKIGKMYLLNTGNLGGFTPNGPDAVLDQQSIGRCLCVESYFAAPTPTVVSSGNDKLQLWRVQTSPSVKLVPYATTGTLLSGTPDDTSFMTSVSSNGAANPIVWVARRPPSLTDRNVYMDAYAGTPVGKTTSMTLLYTTAAGRWIATQTTPNMVPVVANGRAYLAVSSQLDVFSLLTSAHTASQ